MQKTATGNQHPVTSQKRAEEILRKLDGQIDLDKDRAVAEENGWDFDDFLYYGCDEADCRIHMEMAEAEEEAKRVRRRCLKEPHIHRACLRIFEERNGGPLALRADCIRRTLREADEIFWECTQDYEGWKEWEYDDSCGSGCESFLARCLKAISDEDDAAAARRARRRKSDRRRRLRKWKEAGHG